MKSYIGHRVWQSATLIALVFVAGCFASPNQKKVDTTTTDAGSTAGSITVDTGISDTPISPVDGQTATTSSTATGSASATKTGSASSTTTNSVSSTTTNSVSSTTTNSASSTTSRSTSAISTVTSTVSTTATATPSATSAITSVDTGSTASNTATAKLGQACSSSVPCSQGTCVDGMCCDKACTDGCYSCKKADTGQADGTCAPVKADTNPKGTCRVDTVNPCGDLAVCDGAGACKKAPATKVCKAAGCDNGYYNADTYCDGAGKCAVTSKACGAYICTTSGCKTSCAGNSDCTGSNTCDANKTCTVPPACSPKARDCTSTADNNCNGTPDNQESACACKVGDIQTCQAHAGLDGKGICRSGAQTCVASADKTTSSWGTCSGSVGPGTEVCDAGNVDEDCDGQSNEGCQCVNGTTNNPCECGGVATCTNGVLGACSKTRTTFYRDADGDGFGTAADTLSACSAPTGYVANATDCDDANKLLNPNAGICVGDERRTCSGTTVAKETCVQGCFNGACRTDGTIGVAGWVTCGLEGYARAKCSTADGCVMLGDGDWSGVCGGAANSMVKCDGPSDCAPNRVCCRYTMYITDQYSCYTGTACPVSDNSREAYYLVCDPLQPDCPSGTTCTQAGTGSSPYYCRPN